MRIIKLEGEEEKRKGVRYEFDLNTEPLGEGGMGRVYMGDMINVNGSTYKVAIKVLYEDLPEDVIERARREASIKIKHENIVFMHSFIEVVEIDDYRGSVVNYYVISEYLDGITLSNFIDGKIKLKNGELSPKISEMYNNYVKDKEGQSTIIVTKILSAIMSLHDKGFIHRDIDPSNIMITTEGKIKLIDFGVAKQMQHLNTADKGLTSSGQFVGKVEYAAPELVLGSVKEQNFSTDVYAVGILYYQLVTGKLPFYGNSYDVMQSQLHKYLPLKNIKSYQIRRVVSKATEKGQTNRYTTSAQFRAAIDSFVFPEYWYGNINIKKSVFFAIIVAILGVAIWCFFEKEKNSIREKKYNKYLKMLDTPTTKEEAIEGFNGLLALSEEKYLPAMREVANTYAIRGEKTQSTKRKITLGLETTKHKNLIKLVDKSKNEKAFSLIKEIVCMTDSTDYKMMVLLAQYYNNQDVVKRDTAYANWLLIKSRNEAIKHHDNVFARKIDETLENLKQKRN